MDTWTLLQQVFNGLSIASIYMLVAVGITLVFGLTGLVNFAHGEVMMIGAYTVLALAPESVAGFFLALLMAVAVVSLLSFGMERALFRFTLKKPINGFLVSLGLILILQNSLVEMFSADPRNIRSIFQSIWQVGELRFASQRLVVIGVTVVIFAALYLFLSRTRIGIAVRASAMDRETAGLMAVPVSRIITATFVIGGALAAIGGGLLATLFPISPYLGSLFVVKGFAVALVGGLGNVGGAVLAALVIGLTEAIIAGFGYSEWSDGAAFIMMIVILLIRPQGFLRGTEAAY